MTKFKKSKDVKKSMETPCLKCKSITDSIRSSKGVVVCEVCKGDKTLSDLFYYEELRGKE